MKVSELRDLEYDSLQDKLAEAKEELFNLRFQLATNQLDNSARVTQVRRDIARISTVLREQEIQAFYEMEGETDE